MNICVIGGSGAIGHAMARQLCDEGHTVAATYRTRRPGDDDINWLRVDLQVEQDIESCMKQLHQLDWVINAAGLLHSDELQPEKTIRRFSPDNFARVVAANTIPTLTLAKHAMAKLRQSKDPRFAALSARVGSITDNRLGGWYSYRCSKAALNMAIKTLSLEWKHAIPGAVVAALHPGTVASALSDPYSSNQATVMSPQASAAHLISVLQNMTSADTGQFRAWDNKPVDW